MTPQTMQAARIVAPRQIEMATVPRPEPARSQVRLRVLGCGVCASNLGPWLGQAGVVYPLSFGEGGHEAWGEIDAVGDGVDNALVGRRAAALTHHAYATFDIAEATQVVALPKALENVPFPGESVACAINAFRRSNIERDQLVAVIGIGFLGGLMVHLAKKAGAFVIAYSRRPFALALASDLGADVQIRFSNAAEAAQATTKLTQGRLCDCVIEAVGVQATLDLATELTRERGRLVIAGYHQDGQRQVNMQLWNWRGIDVVNAHERDPRVYVQGMLSAIDVVSNDPTLLDRLITHRMALSSLAKALDLIETRPDGFVKGYVVP